MNLYLLKANICLSIFTMIYWAFLRNNTFYKINRVYFVLVILIAAILPLLNLSNFVNQQPEIMNNEIVKQLPDLSLLSQNQEITINSAQNISPINSTISINFQDIFEAIYISGIIIFLCKLIVQIISIFRIYSQSKPVKINGIKIRNLGENISPFSFFNLIFINIKQHSESDLSEIIAHEHTHAKQGHSYDVMLVELFCATFWMNPLAWLLRKFLKQNLEFLTDKNVLASGFNPKNYQFNLLKINGLNISSVSNNFNLSDLKIRIKMMNRKRSSNFQLVKYSLMIPFGAILILAFNITKAKPFDTQKSVLQNLRETVEAVEFIENTSIKNDSNIVQEKQEDKIENSILELKNIFVKDSIEIKNQNQLRHPTIDFKIVNVETKIALEGVQILDRKRTLLGKTNFQGIGFIEYPLFTGITNDERYINKEYGCRSVLFKYKDYPIYEAQLTKSTKSFTFIFDNGRFIIQDEPKLSDTDSTDKAIKTKDWQSLIAGVIKKEKSISTLRSDGSIWIEPKTKWFYCKEDIIKELKKTQEVVAEKRPVYMVNMKVVSADYVWENLSIHSLVSLDYWKPEDGELMKGKYGEQAKNGMYNLMVLEKSNVAVNAPNYSVEPLARNLPKVERCTPSADFPPNALYVIDGKEVDSGFLHKNIKPENIESLEMMNQEVAQKKYGEKGKKGVILISTKKIDKLH